MLPHCHNVAVSKLISSFLPTIRGRGRAPSHRSVTTETTKAITPEIGVIQSLVHIEYNESKRSA